MLSKARGTSPQPTTIGLSWYCLTRTPAQVFKPCSDFAKNLFIRGACWMYKTHIGCRGLADRDTRCTIKMFTSVDVAVICPRTAPAKFFCQIEPLQNGGQRPFLASMPATCTGASQLPIESLGDSHMVAQVLTLQCRKCSIDPT